MVDRSRYVGVSFERRTQRYAAKLSTQRRAYFVGRWSSARAAAIARDRAILFLRLDRPLQVPSASTKLGSASPEELRAASVRERRGRYSAYFGVRVDSRTKHWSAWVMPARGAR